MHRVPRGLAVAAGSVVGLLLVAVAARGGEEPAVKLVCSAAPDWPQWRGPQRDGICRESGLLATWPAEGPARLWSATGIGRGYSAPIVVGDTLYVTGDEGPDVVISAFALDGHCRWRSRNGAAWKGSYPGARSSCAYDDGKLYHMNAHGRVACLDAATGAERWAVAALERFKGQNITWGLSESVLVHGNRVFLTPAGAGALMAALDKRTGATAWTCPPLAGEQACYSSPILLAAGSRQLLVNCGSQHAFAVDADSGALCWKFAHADPKNAVASTPIFDRGCVFITNASRDYGAMFGVRLDGVAATKTWTTPLKISHGGMICVDGGLFGASTLGSIKGWVRVDAATGTPARVAELPAGSLIYADKRFYCLSERGTMMLQEWTKDGFQTRGHFRVADQQDVWAHPVICHGKLFLRAHETLWCYDLRAR